LLLDVRVRCSGAHALWWSSILFFSFHDDRVGALSRYDADELVGKKINILVPTPYKVWLAPASPMERLVRFLFRRNG
jgi:hypothetical protein